MNDEKINYVEELDKFMQELEEFIKLTVKEELQKQTVALVEEEDAEELTVEDYLSDPESNEKKYLSFWKVLMIFDHLLKYEVEDYTVYAYHDDMPKGMHMTIVMEEEWVEGKKISTPYLAMVDEDEDTYLVMKPDMWFDDKWYIYRVDNRTIN